MEIKVRPNYKGIVYKNNKLDVILEAGIYNRYEFFSAHTLIELPMLPQLTIVTNQEVLTKDNISLRFSFNVSYKIVDFDKFINTTDIFKYNFYKQIEPLTDIQQIIHTKSQNEIKDIVADYTSQELIEKRNKVVDESKKRLSESVVDYGVELTDFALRDVMFPKQIQNLFAKQLEAQIRAKSDLENARTQVATARALKNAADLVKENPHISYMQYLEVLKEIASKGSHTFVLQEPEKFSK